ncbi:heparin lyase I family protein [Corallococcus carmarthensis]|uniref:heparin lyase I family protein n=1 Tax=Corallococcus carmarthensis TaxID=2316728 RepID=UPI00148E0A96|nr:heparin lyase I family protein [Corallococcus carmarthensis]NOK17638.1 carbohydrate-binding protein [Corallococcus carmarthensis]
MKALHLWLVACLLPSLAAAEIVWRGDFETGNRSQFSTEQMVSSDRLQVVSSPVAEGKYALKATVKQGDDPINSSGNRNELVYLSNEKVGSEYWYRWKVMFANDFPSVDAWQLFTQWHHDGCCGSPPVEFFVKGELIRLTLNDNGTVWSTALKRGVWQEFIFHVKWSPDASVGYVELWHNGVQVLKKTKAMTMFAGQNNYLKLGLYRDDTIKPVGVVYHDGFIQATSREDVFPVVQPDPDPVVDAGTPADAGSAADAGSPVDPVVDAGSPVDPVVDAGSPVDPDPVADAGTSVDAGAGTGVKPSPLDEGEGDTNFHGGCSASGGSLAAFSLLGLLGLVKARRRRS